MATPSFHNPKSSETKISNSKIIRFYLLPGALDSTLWMIKKQNTEDLRTFATKKSGED
jgi:hypothetical protein